MSPTLAPGEHVLFNRIAYQIESPGRGDVVLVRHPARPGLHLVKRLAALPGDTVVIADDRCWVNGLPWIAEIAPPDGDEPPDEPRILAADEYLLLGDALRFSTDSRQLGPVGRQSIQARAWMVYWPPRGVRNISPAS